MESPARVNQVPALCTHRPSLLPIGRFSEALGLRPGPARRGSGPPGHHGAEGRRPNLSFYRKKRTHARKHARTHARTHAYAQCRPRAAEAAPHGALRHGHRPGQRSPAGGTCWLRPRRGPRRQPWREVQTAVPEARRPPRTFLGYDAPASNGGLPNEPKDRALAPARTVPGAGQRGIVLFRCVIIRR